MNRGRDACCDALRKSVKICGESCWGSEVDFDWEKSVW